MQEPLKAFSIVIVQTHNPGFENLALIFTFKSRKRWHEFLYEQEFALLLVPNLGQITLIYRSPNIVNGFYCDTNQP